MSHAFGWIRQGPCIVGPQQFNPAQRIPCQGLAVRSPRKRVLSVSTQANVIIIPRKQKQPATRIDLDEVNGCGRLFQSTMFHSVMHIVSFHVHLSTRRSWSYPFNGRHEVEVRQLWFLRQSSRVHASSSRFSGKKLLGYLSAVIVQPLSSGCCH